MTDGRGSRAKIKPQYRINGRLVASKTFPGFRRGGFMSAVETVIITETTVGGPPQKRIGAPLAT